jgi:protein ImuB
MRIACLWAPRLALQAILRREARELTAAGGRDEPVALADKPGERARVVALTEAARRAGVRRGMTVAQARVVASGALGAERLRVVPASTADTQAAEAALMDVGYAFAPKVEPEGERVFLEVGDLGQLHPSEQALAQALTAQAARVGLAVRVGLAGSKGVARLAALVQPIGVVPTGGERAFFAAAPVRAGLAALPVLTAADREHLEETLQRWGVRTLGALVALPRAEVGVRLGAVGHALHRLAEGQDDEPFAPRLPPDALEEGTELDYGVEQLEPLAFLLRGLLDRALTRLACRGLACAGLTLRLKLDPRGFDVREVPLAAPTRDPATLLQLARLDLARRPPGAPVVGVAILVLPARVRATQLDLLRPAGPAPEALSATLARLAALVGPENVGAPATVDSLREELVEVRPFKLEPAAATRRPGATSQPGPTGGGPTLGFRRFRPPQPLEVLIGRDGPTALRGAGTTARVLLAAGPYRVSGDWWTDDGFCRDYWDVQASDGAVYRVHQDRRDGGWYLDGYYD